MSQRLLRTDLELAAFASLGAAGLATAIFASSPFAHGAWLIAYLLLVGFLAQFLLGVGQRALFPSDSSCLPPWRVRFAQAGLWNVGVIAVPLGVLSEARLVVVIGSVSLLAALTSLWLTAGRDRASWRSRGYATLLIGMAASVFVGTALAWDLPWT